MDRLELVERNILSEVSFNFSRSGGAGGQNVNKVNTKAELRFNINDSKKLSVEEKEMIISHAQSYTNNELELIVRNIQLKFLVLETFFQKKSNKNDSL